MSSSPAASLLLSVGTRTIFGLLVGLAFLLVKRLFSNKRLGIAIVSILSPTVHAAIVYAVMGLFFPQQNLGSSSNFILDLSNILPTLLCFLLLQFLWSLYKLPLVRNFLLMLIIQPKICAERTHYTLHGEFLFYLHSALRLLPLIILPIACLTC